MTTSAMRLLAPALLVITLLQGTSVTLSLAVRLDDSGRAATGLSLLWVGSYVLAAVLLCRNEGVRRIEWLVRFRLPLLVLLAGVLASTVWSLDPLLSAERAVHLLGSTLVALAIGFALPLPRTLQISRAVLGAVMIGSVAVSLAWPMIGIEDYQGRRVWRGLMASKNTLGFWAAIAMLLFGLQALHTPRLAARGGWALLGAVALLCLWESVSATSVLALLLALIVMAYAWTSARLDLGALASVSLAVLAALVAALVLRSVDTAELIGRSNDLTGRGELWRQTLELIAARPWTGYGYDAIWQPTDGSLWIQKSLLDLDWIVYHAHNGLLQVASSIGLPLAAVTVFFAAQQLIEIVHAHYRTRVPEALFVLGFTVALLVSNYSEARLLVNRELYWIWFVALPLALIRQGSVAGRHDVGATAPFTTVWRRAYGASARRLEPATRRGMIRRREARRVRTEIKLRLARDTPRVHPASGTGHSGTTTTAGTSGVPTTSPGPTDSHR